MVGPEIPKLNVARVRIPPATWASGRIKWRDCGRVLVPWLQLQGAFHAAGPDVIS